METINRTSETVNHHLHAALHQNADISDHIFIPKNFTISQTLQEMTNKQTHTLTGIGIGIVGFNVPLDTI